MDFLESLWNSLCSRSIIWHGLVCSFSKCGLLFYCSSVLIACYICHFHNHCIIAPINVKILWHAFHMIFDVWHLFHEFRIDRLRVMKITNALCCFAPILSGSACLYCLAQLGCESCLDENIWVVVLFISFPSS